MATKKNATAVPAKRKYKKTTDVDWDGARLKYVTTAGASLADVARDFKVDEKVLRSRSRREGWEQEKTDFRGNLSEVVKEQATSVQAEALKRWNEDTLIEAGYLREAARRQYMRPMANGKWRFNTHVSAAGITAAATANVAADKLARLALGTATENHQNTNRNLPVTVDDFV